MPRGVNIRLARMIVLALGVFALSGLGSAEAGETCAASSDQKALHARVLQTELMVAALQCQSHAEYNAFVRKFQKQLVSRGKSLRSMFNRRHGGSGASELNALVTRLANEASQRSMAGHVGFCQQARLVFAEAQAADSSGFDRIAAKVAGATGHAAGSCAEPSSVVGYGTASTVDGATAR